MVDHIAKALAWAVGTSWENYNAVRQNERTLFIIFYNFLAQAQGKVAACFWIYSSSLQTLALLKQKSLSLIGTCLDSSF